MNGTARGTIRFKSKDQVTRGPSRKVVTSYENGRLQTLLLPILATASNLVTPKIKEEPIEQDEQQVPEYNEVKNQQKRAFGVVAGKTLGIRPYQ